MPIIRSLSTAAAASALPYKRDGSSAVGRFRAGRPDYDKQHAEIVGSNPTGGMDVCCECCVLSGRGLCDELITRLEKSYRLWCVVVCDLETTKMRRP
jgi:hypothetical protein